ncbi:diguanylate cyclase domain-containing protein, partial [Kaarinaea lacus]
MPEKPDKRPVFIWAGIAIAVLFWLLDSLLDATVFEPEPFLKELFPVHEPSELWMRFIVISLLIAFGVYANAVARKRAATDEMLRIEIFERKETEKQLLHSEQSLHEFYKITSNYKQTFDEKINRLLKLGCRRFGTDIGILSNIYGNDYRVVDAVSPDDSLEKNTVFPIENTYCEVTIKARKPVSYKKVTDTDMQSHPAYIKFRLETYIGTRVMMGEKLFGTLNFSSPHARDTDFTQAEIDFLQIMGEWIGNELHRLHSDRLHQQAASVFKNTRDGILITDADRNIIAINKAFTSITGYTEEETIGKNPRFLQSGHHDKEFYRKLWESVLTLDHWQGEIWNRRRDGELIPVWQTITVVKDKDGQIENYTSVFSDISAIKQYEERLQHAAHHDALTGLANRVLFGIHLEHSLQKNRRNKGHFALLFLDLDGFKAVNDSLGHSSGDELLQQTATRIKQCLREEDTAARFGGDEFTIILEDIHEPTDAELVAAKLINAISEPVHIDHQTVSVSTSVGISL